ncbi:853_t:CDS:2 [Gigaspora rosea]|nr:853_t:CDS:2 [Gigaspora rosea]
MGTLPQINAYFKLAEEAYVTKCYGITQNPKTENYGIVISYASSGCLRKYLTDHKFIDWSTKLYIIIHIIGGLEPSGKPPFSANQYNQEALIEKVVYEHYRPDIPEHVPNFIKEIINNCWKHEPQERPKADYLNEVLYRYWLDFYEKKDNEITRECKKSDDKAKVLADSNASNHFDPQYYSRSFDKSKLPSL